MTRALLVPVISLLAVGGFSCPSIAQKLPHSWQGYYVSSDGSTPSETVVEVDVFTAYEGQAMFVDFMIKKPSFEKAAGAVSAATNVGKKQFTFSFIDGNGNRGKGIFARTRTGFSLRLQPADTHAPGGAGGEWYGDYQLVRKDAVGRSDRHPWSLKKPQLEPK